MKLKVLKDKILVEKLVKKPEKQAGGLFVDAEVSDSLGIVIAIGQEYSGRLRKDMKVYYGSKREQIRMSGKDIEVMEPDNIVAIIEDSNEKENSKE